MAESTVNLKILASVQEAEKTISAFSKSAGTAIGSIESSFSALKTVAAGAVAFLGGRAIYNSLKEATAAAIESEEAFSQMRVALKLSGDFSEAASTQFEALATSLQETTTNTDESVLASVALAKTFNVTNDQAEKMVRAAANLAAVTGTDLETATRNLGQTLDGTAGRLRETVPQLRNVSEAALKSGAAIDIVAERFDGAAEAAGSTFRGSIIRAQNAFDDIRESIGKFITQSPVVQSVLDALPKIFKTIQTATEQNRTVFQKWINEGLITLIRLIPDLLEALNLLNAAIYGLGEGWRVLLKVGATLAAMLASIGAKSKEAADAIGESFSESLAAIDEESKAAQKSYEDRKKAINDVIARTQKSVDTAVEGARKQVSSTRDASNAIKNQGVAVEGLIDKLKKMVETTAVLKGLSVGINVAINLGQAQKELDKFAASIPIKLKQIQDQGLSKINDLVDAIPGVLSSLQASIEAEGNTKIKDIERQRDKELAALNRQFQRGQITEEELALKREEAQTLAEEDIATARIEIQERVETEVAAKRKELEEEIFKARRDLELELLKEKKTLEDELITKRQEQDQKSLEASGKIVGDLTGVIANVFIPGTGEAIGSIIAGLSQGSEIITNGFASIVEALPEVLSNIGAATADIMLFIANNSAEIISALIGGTTEMVTKLIESAPKIIAAQVRETPKIIFAIAKGIAQAIVEVVETIIRTIENAFAGIFSGIGDFFGGIGDFFGFAEGGVVPPGFPNDSFPARLSSGEMVVPKSQVQNFQEATQSGSFDTDKVIAAMARDSSRPLSITIKVGEKNLADVLLNLNRQGFRTA